MEMEKIKNLLSLCKDDTQFFIGKGKAGGKLNVENPTTSEEREIRWHFNSNLLFEMMIERMMEYEKEKKSFEKRREEFEVYIREVAQKEIELGKERVALYEQLEEIKESIAALTEASNICTTGCCTLRDEISDGINNMMLEINELRTHHEPQIQVIQGNESKLRLRLPNFGADEQDRPLFYLKELKDYLRVNKIKREDEMTVISQTLTKKGKSWFISLNNVTNIEEFEEAFRQRYWNEPTKSRLKAFIDMGKWQKGKKSRVEYAEWIITTIRELEIEIPEHEMITKISRHFDDATALAFRMQNVNDTGKLYDFLTELDKIDQNNTNQQRSAQDENNSRKNFYKQKFRNNFGGNSQFSQNQSNPQNQTQNQQIQGNTQTQQSTGSSQPQGGFQGSQNQNCSNNGNFNQQRGAIPKTNYPTRSNNFSNQNQQRNFGNQSSYQNNQNFGNQNSNGQNYQNRPYRKPNNNSNNENQINALQMSNYFDQIMKTLNNATNKSPEIPANQGNEEQQLMST